MHKSGTDAPSRPWIMVQEWLGLLFAHWPLPAASLRPLLPAGLELDTFEGQAWIGVIPFTMAGVRPRWLPGIPWLSAFHELNVRTYVTAGGRPGIFFLSLDAASSPAVWAARRWFHLPYFRARMSSRHDGEWLHYESTRIDRSGPPADLRVRYRPRSDGALHSLDRAPLGSLLEWLVERYCLYTCDAAGRILRGDIDHAPWQIVEAEAEFEANTMTLPHGILLPDSEPLLQFSPRQRARIWAPRRVES